MWWWTMAGRSGRGSHCCAIGPLMGNIKVIWSELADHQLHTATGAPFKVIRVSARHVAVRPERGTRDYALSISQELEPAVAVYAAGNLPTPAELAHLGI